jgi:hypothetical protein
LPILKITKTKQEIQHKSLIEKPTRKGIVRGYKNPSKNAKIAVKTNATKTT